MEITDWMIIKFVVIVVAAFAYGFWKAFKG